MVREEAYNITGVLNVANNFKINDDHRDFIKKFGVNIYGKDRPLVI